VLVWLADATVVVHLAYLAFIPVGGMLALRWPRLVGPHLAAVAVALVSITIGFDCPLTTWEQSLRRHGGQRPYTNGFVDHYLTGRMYPHGDAWAVQALFAICIVLSYAVLCERMMRSRRSSTHRTVGEAR
jgi:hypothetical protein